MPAVLVHGVPDTHRVWDKLRSHLSRRDVLAPSLPGFGVGTPPGFQPTKETYVAWLIGEIERIGAPVDLVGHDWGSLLVQRVASVRPELIRSWAAGNGPIDREYVWHDLAQQWQTPGVGESIMAMMSPDALAEGLPAAGVPADDARVTASHVDARMKECILGLYRSAVRVGEEWADDVARIDRPALVLWSRDDPYVAPRFAERLAARVHGELVLLEGCGHWWPLERPAEAAAALERFWRTLA
ncbi:MAG TPA: alpha/beta hydrolase [Candidatus Binatus sp.]|jgi:pimeloyl-ACP methyl ester carboxylesterase|nr:alpha/beta hydrolase [Candidatus Binatus sp.]